MAKKSARRIADETVGVCYPMNSKVLTTAVLWNNRAYGSKQCVSSRWDDVMAAYADARDTDRMYYGY